MVSLTPYPLIYATLCRAALYCAMLCCAAPSIPNPYPVTDPHWSRAFTKLSQLIEHHPSAILFDSGTVDPTADSGNLEGKRDVIIPMDSKVLEKAVNDGGEGHSAAVVMNTAP